DRLTGHTGGPRGHAVHRAGLRGRQPGRGYRPGRHRPADPVAMIEAPAPLPAQDSTVPRGAVLRRGIRANPLLVAGAAGSALILLVALLAPLLAPFPGDAGTATHPLLVLRPPPPPPPRLCAPARGGRRTGSAPTTGAGTSPPGCSTVPGSPR